MKVKTILVSQPEPKSDSNPYSDLAKKHKVKVDFRPFIHVTGVDYADFRKQKLNLADYTAIIFTSRNAVDHFFRIAEEARYTVPDTLKYFCVSEAVSYYLQRYVVFRKRKIFTGAATLADLTPQLKKNKNERFLLPSSDILKPAIPATLDSIPVKYDRAILYNTVCSDLSDLSDVLYDVLVFFSPSGIKSLFENFPEFKQNNTRIAAFGPTTWSAVKEAGLELNIKAPTKEAPSMTMAIEQYIKEANK